MNELWLGNAYELIKKIPDKSIDLIYTDLPYLHEDGGNSNTPLGDRMRRKRSELQDIRDGIDLSILDEMCRVAKTNYIYMWVSTKQINDMLSYFKDKARVNILVWCKTNPSPTTNNCWLPDLEYCLCFKGEGSPRYNDAYDLKSKWFVSATNKEDKDKYYHPTIKPLELVKKHLKHSTREGDIVLDPFCGSGTTLKACQELNRQYIGIEINPKYYNIAKDRLNNINAKGEVSLF